MQKLVNTCAGHGFHNSCANGNDTRPANIGGLVEFWPCLLVAIRKAGQPVLFNFGQV